MKKVVIGLLALVFLLVATVITIPFVIDIDKYRPEIVAAANEHINGEIEIKKLNLSLWGQIKVVVEGLKVSDVKGNELVSVGETFVHLPFSSIMGGSPKLELKVDQPKIFVQKYKDGSINLLKLVKETPADTSKATSAPKADKEQEDVAQQDGEPTKVDGKALSYIRNSVVDIELTKANFYFHDFASDFKQSVDDLNILLNNISMTKTMSIKIWTGIQTKIGKDLSVDGPLNISGTLTPVFDELAFKNFETKLKLDFDQILVDVPKTFRKERGQPTNIELEAKLGLTEIEVQKLVVHFLDLNAYADASVKNLGSPPEKIAFNLKADKPGADLDLNLRVSSITTPDIDLKLVSKGIDMDVLFPPSPEAIKERERKKKLEEEKKKKAEEETASKEDVPEEPPLDVDGMLAPLKSNPLLKGMKADADIKIASFKGFNVEIRDIVVKERYANLKADLQEVSMKMFGGSMRLNANIDLKPERPSYAFGTDIKSINLNDAVISQFDTLRETLKGILSFDLKGKGQSLNSDLLIKNLKAKGSFAVRDAEFKTVDVNKMVMEGVTKSIEDVKKKYPQLADKSLNKTLKNQVSRYKVIGGGFTMDGGVVRAPDFKAESLPQKGIDISGNTEIDLVNDKLFARWAVVDTYNQTKLGDVDVKIKNVAVEGVFKEGGKPVEFPVEVGCKLSEPCFKYDSMPGYLLGVAKKNIEKKVKGIFDAEKKKLEQRLNAEKRKMQEKLNKKKAQAEALKKKKMAEMEAKKREIERRKKEEERKAKKKAEEEAKKKLKGKFGKKLGF